MKKYRKICLIPFFGSIIYFIMITKSLKKINKYSRKQALGYLVLMGLLAGIAFFIGGLISGLIFNPNNNGAYFILLFIPLAILFAWPLMTLPLIEYSKKFDKLILDTNDSKTK